LDENPNPLIRKESSVLPGWTILVFLAALPVVGLPVFWMLPDRSMPVLLAAFFGVGLVAVVVAVVPLGAAAPGALGLRAVGWRPVVLGVLATTAISYVVSQIGLRPEGVRQVTDTVRGPAGLLPLLAILALLAPLAEELVFRGLLYGWLAGRWGGRVAFLASSLAFAAAHVELAHAVLVLPLGLWFGWLRWRTDSLVPSLVAHVVNNGVAVAGAVFLAES
jgi:membrane protease YdiL (CAAX protease family)